MIRAIIALGWYMVVAILMLLPPYNLICWMIAGYRRKRLPDGRITAFIDDVFAPVNYAVTGMVYLKRFSGKNHVQR